MITIFLLLSAVIVFDRVPEGRIFYCELSGGENNSKLPTNGKEHR